MKSLNIGILAHVDAGKTSLTERLLYNAGVIKTLGSVDQGNTQTDTMALERQRGITIKAAVTSFNVGNLKLNLIDTPGHPDFIAEVEQSLRVLDAVVLVISAIEGVQPQTRILMRALQKLHIPTLIFVNKVDRMGARDTQIVKDIKAKLFPQVIAMNSVAELATRHVTVTGRTASRAYHEELQIVLANNNEMFLDKLLDHPKELDEPACQKELIKQISRMQVCPIFFGSATMGMGVPELTTALKTYFVPTDVADETLSALIFKIERSVRGEKIAYARVFSGEMCMRSQIEGKHIRTGDTFTAKITALQAFENGTTLGVTAASAGDIVKVWGLSHCAINDYLGQPTRGEREPHLARPSLDVVVSPAEAQDMPRLYAALQHISEQDPFIEVRQNPRDKTLSVRLCGEVQKEVIRDTLTNDYHVAAEFRATTTVCIERPIGTGAGLETGKSGDPYLGTVGLRVEPAPPGAGLQYRVAGNVLGTMPIAFFTAIEKAVKDVLQEGLYGWQVADCLVTLTHTGYYPRQSHAHATFDKSMSSTAGDFRVALTPLALMQALKQAGTQVYEPMNRFELDIPETALARIMQALSDSEARLTRPPLQLKDRIRLEGLVPARRTFEFERQIPDLTNGEGVFVAEFGEYQAVQGMPPTRARTDNNPLERQEYLRRTFSRAK